MRRLTGFIVSMLPLDGDGRRAADETLADWTYEAALAASPFARARVAVRGLCASASVVVRAGVGDLVRPRTFGLSIATVGLSLLLGLAIATPLPSLMRWASSFSSAQVVVLTVCLLPTAAAVTLPLAALTPPFARGRTGPSSLIGLALILTLLSAANLGWIAPRSNQAFREFMASISNAKMDSGGNWVVTPKGLAELTVPELLALAEPTRYQNWRVLRTLNTRAAYVLMVPVCLLLGAQARRLGRARGWKFGGASVAWFGIVALWGGVMAASRTAYRVLFHQPSALSDMFLVLQTWAIPAAAALAAVVLARLASRHEHRPGEDTLFVR